MPPLAPVELLEDVAVHVTATTALKAVARRAPQRWRDGVEAYVVTTQVADVAPELRGDGDTLVDGTVIQASLYERPDDQSSARLVALVDALDGVVIAPYGRGTVRGWRLVPDPDGDSTHTAVDVAFRSVR